MHYSLQYRKYRTGRNLTRTFPKIVPKFVLQNLPIATLTFTSADNVLSPSLSQAPSIYLSIFFFSRAFWTVSRLLSAELVLVAFFCRCSIAKKSVCLYLV